MIKSGEEGSNNIERIDLFAEDALTVSRSPAGTILYRGCNHWAPAVAANHRLGRWFDYCYYFLAFLPSVSFKFL